MPLLGPRVAAVGAVHRLQRTAVRRASACSTAPCTLGRPDWRAVAPPPGCTARRPPGVHSPPPARARRTRRERGRARAPVVLRPGLAGGNDSPGLAGACTMACPSDRYNGIVAKYCLNPALSRCGCVRPCKTSLFCGQEYFAHFYLYSEPNLQQGVCLLFNIVVI